MRNSNQNGGGGGIVDRLTNNDVFVRCCGRGRENVTSVPRWWGWLVVPGLWYQVYLVRDIFVFFYRSFVSLYVRTWYVSGTNHGCMFIEWSVDWMVDEVVVVVVFTLNIHTKCADWPLCDAICFSCIIGASKVNHSASYIRSRLVVAVGGSIHFVCQDPAPRRIGSRGHPFRIAAIDKKKLVRSIRAKRMRFETFSGL